MKQKPYFTKIEKIANKRHILATDLMAVTAIRWAWEASHGATKLPQDDFETLCSQAIEAYLKDESGISMDNVALACVHLLAQGTLESTSRREILDVAYTLGGHDYE